MRLQQKQTAAFADTDFLEDSFATLIKTNIGAPVSKDDEDESDAEGDAESDVEQVRANVDNLTPKEQVRLLKSSMPDIVKNNAEYCRVLDAIQYQDEKPELERLQYLYLTNLAFYLAMAATSDAATRKAHPIHKQLAQFKELLTDTERYGFVSEDDEQIEFESEIEAEEPVAKPVSKRRNRKKTTAKPEIEEPTQPVFKEEDYVPVVTKKLKKRKSDPFGELGGMNDIDIEDKTRRKKSLQFHVNRVDQVHPLLTLVCCEK